LDNINAKVERRVGLAKQLLHALRLLKDRNLHHLALHPNNILISDKDRIVLSNVGYALFNTIPYIGKDNYRDSKFDLTKTKYFEKFDVYSAARIILLLLSHNMDKSIVKLIEKTLEPFLVDDLDKREGFDAFCQKFNDKNFLNQLFGEVDGFWTEHIEPKLKTDPSSLVDRISYPKFIAEFIKYFNNPEHPDVKPYTEKKMQE